MIFHPFGKGFSLLPAWVVDVGDFAAPAELVLEDLTGAVPLHPVNEEL